MNRNQLCSCGSGKRYKHCHGALSASPGPTTLGVPAHGAHRESHAATLHLALTEQKEGRLASAEALYEQALEAAPGDFDAAHMLGVVRLQLGKVEAAARLLIAALCAAPAEATAQCQHNLALSLVALARQRDRLEELCTCPEAPDMPAPFLRAYRLPEPSSAAADGRISIVLSLGTSARALRHSIESIRSGRCGPAEIVAAAQASASDPVALRAELDGAGMPYRVIAVTRAETESALTNIAAAAADGFYLYFLRAGDRCAPGWLRTMAAALDSTGSNWGYGGLRAVADDGAPASYGDSPDVDALLRAQDNLYAHRTASLAFMSFNPVAGGRNLMVRKSFWHKDRALATGAADPFLDWAWHAAQTDEPVYVDAAGYLIPAANAGDHLHDRFARMIGATTAYGDGATAGRLRMENPYLQRELAAFWSRQWRQISAFRAATMPREVVLGCAAMLGLASDEPASRHAA